MRRLLPLILVLLFALPAVALPSSSAPGDGTLGVDNGYGTVVVKARGFIWGHFDSGRVVVEDLIDGDGRPPTVFGAERVRELGNRRTLYIGEDVRFKSGGMFRISIQAAGIDIGAAGRGTVQLDGTGFTDQPGTFSINGGPDQPLPGHPTTFTLGQPSAFGQLGR